MVREQEEKVHPVMDEGSGKKESIRLIIDY